MKISYPFGQKMPSEMMVLLSDPSMYARSIFGCVPEISEPDYKNVSDMKSLQYCGMKLTPIGKEDQSFAWMNDNRTWFVQVIGNNNSTQ